MRGCFTKEQEEVIVKLYTEGRRGQLYCAKAVGSTNVKKVKEVLKKHGIPIRDFSQAASESNKNRALYKNEDYFNEESSNMAWILGFLASDGTVSSSNNTIKIGLSARDKEILEKIKKEIQIENKIVEYTTKDGFDCVDLHWTCAKHKQILAIYGITPNKTFTIKPPLQLSKKYWIDFIRGYFDGDGSVNLIQNKALRWQVCGATKEILQWIIDFLYEEFQIPKVNIMCQDRENILYYFQYSTKATKQIYSVLYTPNSLFLKRKKDKFNEIIK